MPAQLGSSVLLEYGLQGAQQLGGAVVLDYDEPTVSGSIRVTSATTAPWARADLLEIDRLCPSVATDTLNDERAAGWGRAAPVEAANESAWGAMAPADDQRGSAWGKFDQALGEQSAIPWPGAKPSDNCAASPWGHFEQLIDKFEAAPWNGSKPADAVRKAVFSGFRIPVFAEVPYEPQAGSSSNFVVVGGFPLALQLGSVLAGQAVPVSVQLGPRNYTPTFTGDPLRSCTRPAGNSAGFRINRESQRVPVLDGDGNPVNGPSSRDPVRFNPWGKSNGGDANRIVPWTRYSRVLDPGWGVVIPPGPPTPEPGESIIIPVRRLYFVVNEILLARADDNTPIQARDLRIGFDCDSWLPSFSATIPEAFRDAVMPDPSPVELYAYINGSEFKFMVEKVARARAFAQPSVSISGRGIACELDSPYAAIGQHANASDMTAQQLIGAALEYTTYTQTWNITDWLVPAGVFSMAGTPAAVAGYVAEAAGAVLAADWFARDLRMLPRYPVKPWEWSAATTDYVIPAAVAQTESVEWIEKPDYNLVYVSGVQAGVLGQVKRTGTAGDKVAQMVTNPLITHSDAARQRGTSILADTGRKAMMQISMPVLESTGVIDICRLIEFSDGANTRRGIVRANSVEVRWPTVRQTLTIEAAA